MFKLSPRERIAKGKYFLFRKAPFFSYILDNLTLVENEHCQTMGVTQKMELFYNPKFVELLTNNELVGVLVHEVLHIAYVHHLRVKSRERTLWNIATDIVINNCVLAQNFELPKHGLIPTNNSITLGTITIENIDQKSAEQIYDEILKQNLSADEHQSSVLDDHSGWGDGQSSGNGEEKQDEGAAASGQGMEQSEGRQIMDEQKVKEIVEQAAAYARKQGTMPAGMDRIIGNLRKSKVPWRALLRKHVSSFIRSNWTWRRPNRKYIWSDMYMPSLDGEKLNVIVHLDTSGSITQQELGDFVSEILSIARSFNEVEFRVLSGDTKVTTDVLINSFNVNKIKSLKVIGGGGTDHRPLFEYVKKYKAYSMLIAFTDGYTSWPNKTTIPTIVVLNNHDAQAPSWAQVVRIGGA